MREYFSHDYNARTDRKLTNLTMQHGMTGIGVFWCIVEMLYENEGILPTEYNRIAFELRADNDLIKSVINDFELFIIDGDTFYSESVNSRLKIRTNKSETARENVQKRWDKYKGNTPVLEMNNKPNTIKVKESKEKDIKEKENKEEIFIKDVLSFSQYPATMLAEFCDYWTEKDTRGKMKYQKRETFEISKRLVTWQRNQKNKVTSW